MQAKSGGMAGQIGGGAVIAVLDRGGEKVGIADRSRALGLCTVNSPPLSAGPDAEALEGIWPLHAVKRTGGRGSILSNVLSSFRPFRLHFRAAAISWTTAVWRNDGSTSP